MQVADAAWTVVLTLVTIFGLGLVVGFGVLFRRGRRSGAALHASSSGAPIARDDPEADAAKRASILLVQADDAVRDAADELDFAVAQFGADRARGLEGALAAARAQVMEAFELQQRLDDHIPDSAAQRRDWTARIAHLSERAKTGIGQELSRLASLRSMERSAPERLAAARRAVAEVEARVPGCSALVTQLQSTYSAPAVASVADSIERMHAELAAAESAIGAASDAIGAGADDSAAVVAALERVRESEEHTRRAGHLLDAVETLRDRLADAAAALDARIAAARSDIDEARTLGTTATDAAAAAPVIDAVTAVESALSGLDRRHPVDGLGRLEDATRCLNAATTGARNQEQRLTQAREALAGALAAARSEVASTRDFVEGRRGGIGREARTRLAEAERLLGLAEAEADPVRALDTARSAATYARDADALARYDMR